MRGLRGWIVAGVVAIAIAALAYALQPHSDSPEHSSNSDAANGTSAALLFAQAMGHQTSQMTDGFNLPAAGSVMFVFTPTSPYSEGEADQLHAWVQEQGGVLVYASEQGDGELDRAFGVTRYSGQALGGSYSSIPLGDGVTRVSGGDAFVPIYTSAPQVTLLRSGGGLTAGYVQRVGLGRVVVLADPLVLCNGYLDKTDNGRLLADLIGSDSSAQVTFDEYHHGLTVSDFAPQSWLATPWGAALAWLVVAVFLGLFLRGRRFGPVVSRPPDAARSDVEWAVAVGQLLRRSSARAVTLGMLTNATERAVAARNGLPLQPRERFWNALWMRSPDTADELAKVESSLVASAASEHDLLNAARKLHEIAHPVPRR
jgi:hypothetical protein